MKRFVLTQMFLAVVLAIFATGCGESGPELGKVSGTVTVDGKPMGGVQISFVPKEGGKSSMAVTNDVGGYTLEYSKSHLGALPGIHTVSIIPPAAADTVDIIDSSVTSDVLVDSALPEKYVKGTKTVEVSAGSNTIDLEWP